MKSKSIKLYANRPFFLDQPEQIWQVKAGRVEVYYTVLDEKEDISSSRRFLHEAKKGDLILNLKNKEEPNGVTLLVVSPNATIIAVDKADFKNKIPAVKIDRWVLNVGAGLQKSDPPSVYRILEPAKKLVLGENQVLFPEQGLLWVRLQEGQLSTFGAATQKDEGENKKYTPVSPYLWVKTLEKETTLTVLSTSELLADFTEFEKAFGHLRQFLTTSIQKKYVQLTKRNNKGIQEKIEADDSLLRNSLLQLRSIVLDEDGLAASDHFSSDNLLLATCQLIGDEDDFEFSKPQFDSSKVKNTANRLHAIGQISSARPRKIILRGDWWKQENGHLLAFTEEDKQPLALIQDSSKSYLVKNVATQKTERLTKELAGKIAPIAYMFFYAFDRKLDSFKKIMRFAIKGLEKEAGLLFVAAMSGSLIALLTPILTGILFDDVIPQADRSFLLEVVLIMLVIATVQGLLHMVKGILQIRLETKSNINLQAGLMDHLLRLPVTFYKKYTAGDLTHRALGINAIRKILSGTLLGALLSGVFSFVNIFLLFYYAPRLAWIGIGLAVFAILFVILVGWLKLKYDRQIAEAQGDIQGSLFEFLSGITKVRITGSEKRAFSLWANKFARLKTLAFKSGSYQNYVETFKGTYLLFSTMFFFGFLYFWMKNAAPDTRSLISVGAFMAFISAFKQFLGECLKMSLTIIMSLNVIPLFERVKPILDEVPESNKKSVDPGQLKGEIELNSVSFRYGEGLPLVIKDVSLKIRPGEMVAFVGPSGSGKSTLLRILLGFEKPASGSVYYDGQAFDELNKDLVRQQLGVVLQDGALMSGSIYKNIVGHTEMSLEDAWEAAKMAGMEEDIKQMPMEMHTVISEGAGTFSGGQKQRLMIARAIVHNPKILYMDEATSSLDNRTQRIVSDSLDRMQATRIVIAHRMSTVMDADCIYVLDRGRIKESGTYEELLDQEGIFAKLVERQMA